MILRKITCWLSKIQIVLARHFQGLVQEAICEIESLKAKVALRLLKSDLVEDLGQQGSFSEKPIRQGTDEKTEES